MKATKHIVKHRETSDIGALYPSKSGLIHKHIVKHTCVAKFATSALPLIPICIVPSWKGAMAHGTGTIACGPYDVGDL